MAYNGFGTSTDVVTSGGSPNFPTFQPGGGGGAYFSLTPYICGQTGDTHAQFTGNTAVADAVAQIVTDGVSTATVYIKPGSYGSSSTITVPSTVAITFLGLGTEAQVSNGGFGVNPSVFFSDSVDCQGNCTFVNMYLSAQILGDFFQGSTLFSGCNVNAYVTNILNSYNFIFDNCIVPGSLAGDGNAIGNISVQMKFKNCLINGTAASLASGSGQDFFEFYDCVFGNSGAISNGSTGSNPGLKIYGCQAISNNTLIQEYSASTTWNLEINGLYFDAACNTGIYIGSGVGAVSYLNMTDITFLGTNQFINEVGNGGSTFVVSNGQFLNGVTLAAASQLKIYNSKVNLSAFSLGAGAAINYYDCVTTTNSLISNTDSISTSATDGFLYIPTCNGTPMGTPTSYGSSIPIIIDSGTGTAYKYYSGSWLPL